MDMSGSNPCIGVILPSSNRTVERAAHAIRQVHPTLDICMTRVPYSGHPADGYALEPFRYAARMLAEARPGIILWNATRGALLGFEPDRLLCTMIEEETGIPATTTALATLQTLRTRRLRRIGLVVQGTEAESARLFHAFKYEDIGIVASTTLGIADNFLAVDVDEDTLAAAADELCSRAELDATLIWSTNLGGYALPGRMGRAGIPLLDSATIGFDIALETLKAADAKLDVMFAGF